MCHCWLGCCIIRQALAKGMGPVVGWLAEQQQIGDIGDDSPCLGHHIAKLQHQIDQGCVSLLPGGGCIAMGSP